MTTRRLTELELMAFAERLDVFGAELSPEEQYFLRAVLCDAEAAPDQGSRSMEDRAARTFRDIVIAIHQGYRSPPISLNPQPIPSNRPGFTDTRPDRR